MKGWLPFAGVALAAAICLAMHMQPWGFYGHRLINRMAVFILPTEMIGVFKAHIEYLTAHAVDPDKRRYATKYEAERHYMDLDHWGAPPFEDLPRSWSDAIAQNLCLYEVTPTGDTIDIFRTHDTFRGGHLTGGEPAYRLVRQFAVSHILPDFYAGDRVFPRDTIAKYFPDSVSLPAAGIHAREEFSEHGILPYHLLVMYRRLVRSYAALDLPRILRTAAEIGHYIGDAHVPLHTTENYNGQQTGQEGIHAFWESRIPELFAEDEFDFWVGTATYIDDPAEYFWGIVEESHMLVSQVLGEEMRLRGQFPADRQFCSDDRLGVTILTQCRDYAQAYREAMNGMVEERMRKAVRALGNVWYSAWVDAGQPNLDLLVNGEPSRAELEAGKILDEKYRQGRPLGRSHPND